MPLRILSIALALAAASAHAGGPPPTVFHKPGKGGVVLPLRSVSTWGVSPNGTPVVVRFECEPFSQNRGRQSHSADATIRLAGQTASGPAQTNVVQRVDSTDINAGDDQAAVSATVAGLGVGYLNVELTIDDRNRPAGSYDTVVTATLSAL